MTAPGGKPGAGGKRGGVPAAPILSQAAAARAVRDLQSRGGEAVFTNGCFDILHAGHADFLRKARRLGDLLIVGVNSDASVRRLKGDGRPVNTLRDRTNVLSALRSVDLLCAFGDDTPLRLIRKVRPDILVKGGDWPVGLIVGREDVEGWGGRVRSIPLLSGCSTTEIIRRIRALDIHDTPG